MATPMDGVALVFGSASGIGRETAFIFAENGASSVIFADINLTAAQAASEHSKTFPTLHPSYRTSAVPVDTGDKSSVRKVVAMVKEDYGRLDYVVNSAGVAGTDLGPEEEAMLDGCFRVNAKGIKYTTDAAAEMMAAQEEKSVTGRGGKRSVGRGAIVNVLSINGVVPVPGQGHYGASKMAGIAFSNITACGLAKSGIRVNAVLPSYSETAMLDQIYDGNPGLQQFAEKLIPTGRAAKAEEIGEVIYFLCTPGASYVHGANIVIDAGLSLTRGLM